MSEKPAAGHNPEPHKDIAERQLTSLDMAWYMLAAAEAHAGCDVGIAAKLDDRLGGHRLREGEFLLCQARLSSAIAEQDEDRFFDQLPQMLEDLAAIKSAPRREEFFTPLVPQTYVARPMNSSEKAELSGTAGEFCALFLAVATLCSPSFAIDKFAARLLKEERFTVSDVFLDGLRKTGNPPNSISWLIEAAPELQRQRRHGETVQPESMYMFVLRIIEIADRTGQLPMIAAKLYEVIASYWQHIWEHQRFRLKSPMLHEPAINDALANQNSSELQRLIKLMAAIAPLLNFSNPANVQDYLRTIAQKHPV